MGKTTLKFLPNELLVMESNKIESIAYSDIVSISCDKPYLIIQTRANKHIIQHCLNDLITHLPRFFCQCNKSLILNLLYAKGINKDSRSTITIGNDYYPVSRRRIESVWQRFIEIKTSIYSTGICNFCKNKTA